MIDQWGGGDSMSQRKCAGLVNVVHDGRISSVHDKQKLDEIKSLAGTLNPLITSMIFYDA